jgi:hypothetical protein
MASGRTFSEDFARTTSLRALETFFGRDENSLMGELRKGVISRKETGGLRK